MRLLYYRSRSISMLRESSRRNDRFTEQQSHHLEYSPIPIRKQVLTLHLEADVEGCLRVTMGCGGRSRWRGPISGAGSGIVTAPRSAKAQKHLDQTSFSLRQQLHEYNHNAFLQHCSTWR